MGSVGSVQFQIVPCSSLYFSRSIGPFQCSRCYLPGFDLLYLSLPKRFPLFILASSVCKSLQCLISALTQGGKGGHFFRLTCSLANKHHWRVWGALAVSPPHWVIPPLTACVLSPSTLLRLQVALPGTV